VVGRESVCGLELDSCVFSCFAAGVETVDADEGFCSDAAGGLLAEPPPLRAGGSCDARASENGIQPATPVATPATRRTAIFRMRYEAR
jgi:hypothetical protein